MPATNENPVAAVRPQTGLIDQSSDSKNLTPDRPMAQAPATPYQGAVAAIKRGIAVFPCEPGTKIPAVDGWQHKASTDPDEIHAMWHCPVTGWELPRNPATPTGNGRQVVDLDVKAGRNGPANFASLADLYDWDPKTYRTRTPSGGEHLWFRVEGKYRNSEGRLGTGIDTRGDGGLVLLPGALNGEGAPYVLLDDAPEAPLHPKIVARLIPWEPPAERQPEISTDLDDPYAVTRAAEYLRSVAPIPTEGGTGNSIGYSVAAELKKYGISRDTAARLMDEHWNSRHEFPRQPGELESLVNNGFDYGRGAAGELDPRSQFEPLPEDPSSANASEAPIKSKRRITYIRSDRIQIERRPDPLVQDLIDQGALAMLRGPSGHGKTAVASDIADCSSRGRPWRGKRVKNVLVVYCAIEGGDFVLYRFKALEDRYRSVGAASLAIIRVPISFNKAPKDYSELVEAIREAEADYDKKVGLIVVDTVSRGLNGADENSPEGMGAFVGTMDRLRAETGAAVLLVHHQGKDASRGARGHSLLQAAVDTEIEIMDRTFTVTKQRDMRVLPPFQFELTKAIVGEFESGDAAESILVHYPEPGARPSPESQAAIEGKLSEDDAKLLSILRSFDNPDGAPSERGGVSLDTITDAAVRIGWTNAKGTGAKDVVRRGLNRLKAVGLATSTGARSKTRWQAVSTTLAAAKEDA